MSLLLLPNKPMKAYEIRRAPSSGFLIMSTAGVMALEICHLECARISLEVFTWIVHNEHVLLFIEHSEYVVLFKT